MRYLQNTQQVQVQQGGCWGIAPYKVLIVDDDAETLRFLDYALTRNGYEPIAAEDGEEAIDALSKNRIDIIVSDVAMPRLNGYQLYQRVREQGLEDVRYAFIPVIFLTARGMDSDIRYAKSLGVNDCLIKPVTIKDLLAAIQGGIQSSQMILRALDHQAAHKYILFSINGYELRIDFNQNRVWCNKDELPLSTREVLVLRRLAQTPGKVVAITELVNVTHGIETDNIEAGVIIRPLIRDIRNKLKKVVGLGDGSLFLQNVRGRGYMLTHLQCEN